MSNYDSWKLSDGYDDGYEDSVNLTVRCNSDYNLTEFLDELNEQIFELAKKYNVEVD